MMANLNKMNSEAEALKLDRKNKEALDKYNETMKKIEEFHQHLVKRAEDVVKRVNDFEARKKQA